MTTYVITTSDSIVAKLATMSPADTLLLRGGTYTEGDLNPPSGASDSARTIIAPYQNEPVTIQPSGGYNRVFTFYNHYVTASGFILDAINCNYDCLKMEESGGVYSHHIRVADCEIKNANNNGVLAAGNPNGGQPGGFNEILRCHIHNNARFNFNPYGHGVYITSPSNIIEGCEIHDHNYDTAHNTVAVHIYNGGNSPSGGLDSNIVRKNKIYNMLRGGAMVVSWGFGSRIYDNLCFNNYGGIDLGGAGENILVANNTIVGHALGGIIIKGTFNARLVNNILWQNARGIQVDEEGGTYTEDHNLIDIDPLFVDAAGGDFRLQPGSPAIDRAVDLSAYFHDDFFGNARV